MKLSAFAFAKVNLYLKVLSKRNDGLHNLSMVMQSVSLADKVTLTTDVGSGITVVCDGAEIGDNIAETAAVKYFEKANIPIPNIRIKIEKHIPISGGLAGGSADAAAVLVLCNRLYGKLTKSELLDLAGTIGADVPFCLVGGCARVCGFGEKVEPIDADNNYALILVKAGKKRSTGHMYALLDERDTHIESDADKLVDFLIKGDKSACEHMENDFAVLWDDDISKDICSRLKNNGASAVSLSGSGPTFFGVFYDSKTAESCYGELKNKYADTYLCYPEICGVKIIE